MSHCGARELGRSAWTRVRRFFSYRRVEPDHHDGFAELLHAADHVTRAGRAPIPERQEHVACLRHLEVAAHASAFPKALPVGAKELMPDGVLPGPAVAELICAFGAARDDLRDAVALWCQRLAQQLIVVKVATACDDDLHEDLPGVLG